MKHIFSILIIYFFVSTSTLTSQINWMSWEDAVEASKAEPKKFFVDVYTAWCGWCKKMDRSTFADPSVAAYMNDNYYSIKFDAEMKETITIQGKDYNFVSGGKKGYHELAYEITKGRLSYPTIVFLDEQLKVLQPIPGFRTVSELNMIMHYFAGNFHKNTPWKSFASQYKDVYSTRNMAVPVKGQ